MQGCAKRREHPIFPYKGVEDDAENYWTDEMNDAARANRLVLSKERKPPFYGLFFDDGNTVGGFGNWIQDCEVLHALSAANR